MINNKFFICFTVFSLALFLFEFAVAEPADKSSLIPAIVPLLIESGGGDRLRILPLMHQTV